MTTYRAWGLSMLLHLIWCELGGNCNGVSAFISCFIFCTISTLCHLSCHSIWAHPRSGLTCRPHLKKDTSYFSFQPLLCIDSILRTCPLVVWDLKCHMGTIVSASQGNISLEALREWHVALGVSVIWLKCLSEGRRVYTHTCLSPKLTVYTAMSKSSVESIGRVWSSLKLCF